MQKRMEDYRTHHLKATKHYKKHKTKMKYAEFNIDSNKIEFCQQLQQIWALGLLES
jgi:hypothetical protein